MKTEYYRLPIENIDNKIKYTTRIEQKLGERSQYKDSARGWTVRGSNFAKCKNFLFSKSTRPAAGHTKPCKLNTFLFKFCSGFLQTSVQYSETILSFLLPHSSKVGVIVLCYRLSVVIVLCCYLCSSVITVLFYVLIVCTVTLPPGVNPIAVDKYTKF